MEPSYCYEALVVRVVDGDTVDASVSLGFNVYIKERFRLASINAPETYGVKKESAEYQAGLAAKNRLIELIENKNVIIVSKKKGKYGRYIADIYIENKSVSETLLEEGLVEPY